MTANELADWLDKKAIVSFTEYFIEHLELAADLLRQQQAEIEKLKSIVEDTIGQAFYEDDYHKAQVEIEALKKKTQYWLHTLHCTCGNHWEVSTYPPVLKKKEQEK